MRPIAAKIASIILCRRNTLGNWLSRASSPDFSQRVDFRVAEREGTGEHMKKAAVVG